MKVDTQLSVCEGRMRRMFHLLLILISTVESGCAQPQADRRFTWRLGPAGLRSVSRDATRNVSQFSQRDYSLYTLPFQSQQRSYLFLPIPLQILTSTLVLRFVPQNRQVSYVDMSILVRTLTPLASQFSSPLLRIFSFSVSLLSLQSKRNDRLQLE